MDVGSMVIPRTIVDATRTPELTLETLRRESTSSVLFAVMGFFGVGAAYILSPLLKNKYGVPLYKLDANNQTIDAFANAWSDSIKKVGTNDKHLLAKTYFSSIFDGVKGDDALKSTKKEMVETLSHYLTTSKDYKLSSQAKDSLFKKLVAYSGNSDDLKLMGKNFENMGSINAKDLVKDSYAMGRAFLQEKVLDEFKKTDNLLDNGFIKQIKKLTVKQTAMGLAVATAIGMSVQTVNRWMTKKKTGIDGFAATKGNISERDKSAKFQMMKVGVSGAMAALTLGTIGKFKDLPKLLQFNGAVPGIAQLKLVYGLTIISRILAARDKYELRETSFRDFLGFLNWLVLGGVVSNFVGYKLDKNLVKPESIKDLTGIKKILSIKLKSHSDLLYASDYVKSAIKNGTDASELTIKNVIKRVDEPTRQMIKKLNKAHISGYLYSGLALGVLIPLLNKTITNNAKKEKQNAAVGSQEQSQQKPAEYKTNDIRSKILSLNFPPSDSED